MCAFPDRRAVVAAALMMSFTGAAANPGDAPTDYSHILPLSVGANQAVVQLRVPRDVYLNARSPELDDLRVFDAAGRSMPFALVDLAPPAVVNRPATPVAVFPVHGPARDAGRVHDSLQIRTGTDGAVISVTGPSRTVNDELVSIVLDLRAAARAAQVDAAAPVGSLALSLPPGTGSYNAWVALDVSDDLQSWHELAEAAVSWLVNEQGASVQKHRIEFAPRPFRYARIRWLDGKPIAFSAIHAEYVVERPTPRHQETIVLQASAGGEGRDLMYTVPVAVPARSLGLVFKGQNIVMPVQAGQYQAIRKREAGGRTSLQLQSLVNATFYQMVQDGRHRASGDIEIPVTHASQWVVRPHTKVSERPDLRLGWTPASMVFVAGGMPPYSLAFGRTGVRSAYVGLPQVAPGFSARELALLEAAKPGDLIRQQLSGKTADDVAASASGSQRGWLWALLVGGVVALAAMAWHLFRQLKGGASEPPPA